MNPRFPTSARYRRHPRNKPLVRLLAFGLVLGSGLFFLLRSKDPKPVEPVVQQEQEQASQPERALRTTAPAPDPATRPESRVKPEIRVENRPDVKIVPTPEVKPAPPPALKPAAQPDKPDLQAAIRPSIKPDLSTIRPEIKPDLKAAVKPEVRPEIRPEGKPPVKSGNTQEVKLDIKPETRAEAKAGTVAKKGDAKAEPPAKGKADAPGTDPKKPPPLPQPKGDEEDSASHPLPDTLQPKLREQEMKLTFYKGLAMKKMILPEEPTGKKVIPPFLAGVTPVAPGKVDGTTQDKKPAPPRPDAPKPATEAHKAAPDAQKPSADSKKVPSDAQKSPGEAKKKSYQVQIAILSDNKKATAMVEKLRTEGATRPHVSAIKYESGRALFRVRLGPFATQSEAAKAGQRWQAPGQPALVTAVEE